MPTDSHGNFQMFYLTLSHTDTNNTNLQSVNVSQQEDETREGQEKEYRGVFGQISTHDDPFRSPMVSQCFIFRFQHCGSGSTGACQHLNNREEIWINNITFIDYDVELDTYI